METQHQICPTQLMARGLGSPHGSSGQDACTIQHQPSHCSSWWPPAFLSFLPAATGVCTAAVTAPFSRGTVLRIPCCLYNNRERKKLMPTWSFLLHVTASTLRAVSFASDRRGSCSTLWMAAANKHPPTCKKAPEQRQASRATKYLDKAPQIHAISILSFGTAILDTICAGGIFCCYRALRKRSQASKSALTFILP